MILIMEGSWRTGSTSKHPQIKIGGIVGSVCPSGNGWAWDVSIDAWTGDVIDSGEVESLESAVRAVENCIEKNFGKSIDKG